MTPAECLHYLDDRTRTPLVKEFADGMTAAWARDGHARDAVDETMRSRLMKADRLHRQRPLIVLREASGKVVAAFNVAAGDLAGHWFAGDSTPTAELLSALESAAAAAGSNTFLEREPDARLGEGWRRLRTAQGHARVRIANGLLHNLDGPAVEYENGGLEWWVGGRRHRIDGPACAYADGETRHYQRGRLHRIGAPAVARAGGATEWWLEGRRHRIDGPAVEFPNGDYRWYRDDVPHRDGGPAVSCQGVTEYRRDGRLHRDDGPAYESGKEKLWLRKGKPHRLGGPAVERSSGRNENWIEGKRAVAPFLENWRAISGAIHFAAVRKEVENPNVYEEAAVKSAFSIGFHSLLAALEKSGVSTWDDAARAAVAGLRNMDRPDTVVHSFNSMTLRCLGLGAEIAAGNAAGLPEGVRAELLGLLDRLLDDASPPLVADPRHGIEKPVPRRDFKGAVRVMLTQGKMRTRIREDVGSPTAEFAHGWVQGGARGRRVYASGTVALDRVDAAEAPVFATLATPGGGAFDLRRIDGATFRPVFSPGGWTPATEDEFRAAAADGGAWRDNPLLERPKGTNCALGVRDVAMAPKKTREGDNAAQADSETACLARAGRLVVVDGVVHRRTAEPVLEIVATEIKPDEARAGSLTRHQLAWRLGSDLSMTDRQETFRLGTDRVRTTGRKPGFFAVSAVADEHAQDLTFPPGGHQRAAKILALWEDEPQGGLRGWAEEDDLPGAVIVDGQAPGPVAWLAATETDSLASTLDAIAKRAEDCAIILDADDEGMGREDLRDVVARATSEIESGDPNGLSDVASVLAKMAEQIDAGQVATFPFGLKASGLLSALLATTADSLRELAALDAADDHEILSGFGMD